MYKYNITTIYLIITTYINGFKLTCFDIIHGLQFSSYTFLSLICLRSMNYYYGNNTISEDKSCLNMIENATLSGEKYDKDVALTHIYIHRIRPNTFCS
jgi:hypothetical protein